MDTLDIRYRKIQKRFSRKTNKQSNRRKRIKSELAEIKRHQTRVRKSNIHKATTELAKTYSYIAIEDLKVQNMTASAKGTAEEPGKNVKAKAGLNREILNVSPYTMREQLAYKTIWYGSHLEEVDPEHTSQTCSSCGHVARENRASQAKFECQLCGYQDNADINAAMNILSKSGISETAQGLRKTPSKPSGFLATSKSTLVFLHRSHVTIYVTHHRVMLISGLEYRDLWSDFSVGRMPLSPYKGAEYVICGLAASSNNYLNPSQ